MLCWAVQESRTVTQEDDPLDVAVAMSRQWKPAVPEGLPDVFTGGWVGFVGYDTVRYTYPQKIPFESAPADDRGLLDLHLALYKDMAIFDGATKLIYLVSWVKIEDGADMRALYKTACNRVCRLPHGTLCLRAFVCAAQHPFTAHQHVAMLLAGSMHRSSITWGESALHCLLPFELVCVLVFVVL